MKLGTIIPSGFKELGESNLKTTFKIRVKGKMETFEMKNLSYRMAIRFFLNHEKELKEQFKGYKQIER
jgi:hypothetical protein